MKNNVAYEELRKAMLWRVNTPARYPDVIVQADSEKEIQAALRFTAANDLQLVVRSSGHNTAGAVLRTGGMLLDISSMTDILVDTEKMTAIIQPGLNLHYCYQQLANYGYIFPHLLWENVEEDEVNNRWYEQFNIILQAYTSSHYINQVDNEHHPDRIRNSFSKENWQRLATLRQKYDPENRFYNYLGFD